MKNYRLCALLLCLSCMFCGFAQRAAISTDVLKWASLSPNISADVVLSSHMSLNLEASFNPLNNVYTDDLSAEHIMFSAEGRYWFKRPLYSHYLGLNAMAVVYNVELGGKRYKGQAGGIGLGYGYSFIISKRFNLTPYVGFGVGYLQQYVNPELGANSGVKSGFKPMLTKLGVSFSYIID